MANDGMTTPRRTCTSPPGSRRRKPSSSCVTTERMGSWSRRPKCTSSATGTGYACTGIRPFSRKWRPARLFPPRKERSLLGTPESASFLLSSWFPAGDGHRDGPSPRREGPADRFPPNRSPGTPVEYRFPHDSRAVVPGSAWVSPGGGCLPSPLLREYTASVLKDLLGLTEEEIARLSEEGVL